MATLIAEEPKIIFCYVGNVKLGDYSKLVLSGNFRLIVRKLGKDCQEVDINHGTNGLWYQWLIWQGRRRG